MSFLVDTNVLSELARRKVNPGVSRWAQSQFWVHLSAVTVEEVLFGLAWKQNARLLEWFERFLAERVDLLPVTGEIARASGWMRGRLQASGKTREQADMLIAGTASVHGLTLVTRNVSDFEQCGVALLNPFT